MIASIHNRIAKKLVKFVRKKKQDTKCSAKYKKKTNHFPKASRKKDKVFEKCSHSHNFPYFLEQMKKKKNRDFCCCCIQTISIHSHDSHLTRSPTHTYAFENENKKENHSSGGTTTLNYTLSLSSTSLTCLSHTKSLHKTKVLFFFVFVSGRQNRI